MAQLLVFGVCWGFYGAQIGMDGVMSLCSNSCVPLWIAIAQKMIVL